MYCDTLNDDKYLADELCKYLNFCAGLASRVVTRSGYGSCIRAWIRNSSKIRTACTKFLVHFHIASCYIKMGMTFWS